MRTKMNPASLAAYWRMRDAGELPEKERAVYAALLLHGPMTREQIADKTGMKEGSACGRVNKLMYARGMLEVIGEVWNPSTKHYNEVVRITEHRLMELHWPMLLNSSMPHLALVQQ